MTLQFRSISDRFIGSHQYSAWVLEADWQREIAHEYSRLRTETRFPVAPICFDGLVFDVRSIQDRIRANTIPVRAGGNFDVVRSDFGEVLAYLALEQQFQTQFGYKSVRDRELIQLPGRGIDGVGVEEREKLTLLLSETKVSTQNSPPAVVDTTDDCLRNQHIGHITEDITCRKIWDISRRATSAQLQNLFLAAALMFQDKMNDYLDVITCCVLVRPEQKYAQSDYGSFLSSPQDFAPNPIRFLVLCIPQSAGSNIEEVIDAWYQRINDGGLDGEA